VEQNVDNIIKESSRIKQILSEEAEEIAVGLESATLGVSKSLFEETKHIRDAFLNGVLSAKKAAQQMTEITNKSAKQRLDIIAESIDEEIKQYVDSGAKKIAAEERYNAAKKLLADIKPTATEEQKQHALNEVEVSKALYEAALEFYKKYMELMGKKAENDNDQQANALKRITESFTMETQLWQMRFDLMKSVEEFGQTVIEANFNRRMEMLDAEMDAIDRKAEKEKGIIEQSTLTEEQKNKRLAEIDLKAANQKEIVEAKRRKAERQKAIADKAMGALKILTELASTITQINLQAALALASGNPFGYALATSQIPFAIASSAVGLASIAAVPLPKLKHGTKDFTGGPAILGDGGKSELVIEPDGSMYVTDDSPKVHYLPKHSVVLPDAEKVLAGASGFKQKAEHIIMLSSVNQGGDDLMKLDKTIKNEFAGLNKTIKNKREVVIRRGMNKDLLLRYGSDYWKYIN